jgi:hypothetical protein
MSEPVQVKCRKCGNPIGEQVNVNGVTLFHCGGVLNREQRGWCAKCGDPFYWYVNDAYMTEVIAVMQVYRKAHAQ